MKIKKIKPDAATNTQVLVNFIHFNSTGVRVVKLYCKTRL